MEDCDILLNSLNKELKELERENKIYYEKKDIYLGKVEEHKKKIIGENEIFWWGKKFH